MGVSPPRVMEGHAASPVATQGDSELCRTGARGRAQLRSRALRVDLERDWLVFDLWLEGARRLRLRPGSCSTALARLAAVFGRVGRPQPRDTARAMSQENLEIVRRVFDAFKRGDLEAVVQLVAPDGEWYQGGHPCGSEISRAEGVRWSHARTRGSRLRPASISGSRWRKGASSAWNHARAGGTSERHRDRCHRRRLDADGKVVKRSSASSDPEPKPSKPPGSRSRRCRRRTWRSCGPVFEAYNRRDLAAIDPEVRCRDRVGARRPA